MKQAKEIRYVDFRVYLPGIKCDPDTGKILDAVYVKTVEIPVYGKLDFLTPEAHLIIDEAKIRAYFEKLPDYTSFMGTQLEALGNISPNEALLTHEGQRDLICLLSAMKLTPYS